MSVDWLNFKSCLDGPNKAFVVYVDDEGSEIPIESECEFQEAVRLAKLNKKHMKIILYGNKSKQQNTVFDSQCKNLDYLDFTHQTDKSKNMFLHTEQASVDTENKCHCNGDVPPEWFLHYMKKFKKELLQEIKSTIASNSQYVEKEKKAPRTKDDAVDLTLKRIEAILTTDIMHGKKKMKGLEKSLKELLDQRMVKLSKKIGHPSISDKLDKLDNKTRILLDEKRKLLERKRHSKSKFEKNVGVIIEKEIYRKSASFNDNQVCLLLPPNGEFVLTLNFTNNGICRWEAPWLECFDFMGLYPKETKLCLPRLSPMESGFITLRGKVCEKRGLHHFKCRLFDGLERFGGEFTCLAQVEVEELPKKSQSTVNLKIFDEGKNEDTVGVLIDFEKDEFTATRKKIEENINEIEKRLQDLDFLRPSTSEDDCEGNVKTESKSINELQSNGIDFLQNLEGKERNWKEKLEQEGVHFGVDCLRLTTPNQSRTTSEQNDDDEREWFDKTKDCGDRGSSDSELSIIFVPEEDENFIVVSLPSKSPSPAESVNEDNKLFRADSEESRDSEEKLKSTEQRQSNRNEIPENVETLVTNETPAASSSKNRRPPFVEEVAESKAKKIKSSTEYNFTTSNLTEPTFVKNLKTFPEEKPSRFSFTFGETEREKSVPEDVFMKHRWRFDGSGDRPQTGVGRPHKGSEKHSKKEKTSRRHGIAVTDSSGKLIYAVHRSGFCLPVKDLLEAGGGGMAPSVRSRRKENQRRTDRLYDRFNDVPAVNVLPSALMNGASNVASFALNTAKSVINNLNSAFVTEGKTEPGKVANEGQKGVSTEALLKLFEMGFSNFELNQKLLLIHGNDLDKVVEALIQIQKNS